MPDPIQGFTHIGDVLRDILKEIQRRCELRPRLEAEMGRQLNDKEFLVIAECAEADSLFASYYIVFSKQVGRTIRGPRDTGHERPALR